LEVNSNRLKLKTNHISKAFGALPKLSLLLSVVALCVISGGLFINSHPIIQQELNNNGDTVILNTPVELPKSAAFAGEPVPLSNFDTRESLDRELLVNSNFHSQTILYLKKAPRYFSILEPILKENGVPDDFKYLALAESGFYDRVVSPSGAVGIWQFMKSAALENGLEVTAEVDERYHIEKATRAACNYLNEAYRKYGNWTMTAASYNSGISGITRQTDSQDSNNYYDLLLNEETARYLFRIISLKLIMENPEKYGFKVTDEEKYPIIKTRDIELKGAVNNFTDYARSQGINYKILKYFNPWLRQPYLKNPANKTYTLKIPEEGYRAYAQE
jgi:membrane-bound lytic murein transglycosylase D